MEKGRTLKKWSKTYPSTRRTRRKRPTLETGSLTPTLGEYQPEEPDNLPENAAGSPGQSERILEKLQEPGKRSQKKKKSTKPEHRTCRARCISKTDEGLSGPRRLLNELQENTTVCPEKRRRGLGPAREKGLRYTKGLRRKRGARAKE